MNRLGNGAMFNVLAVLMLALAALACLCTCIVFFVPEFAGTFGGPAPLVQAVPTLPPTPTSLFPATWTPTPLKPPPPSPTRLPTYTPGPVDTPTITFAPLTTTRRTQPLPVASPSFTPSIHRFDGSFTLRPSPISPCGASYIYGTIANLAGKPETSSSILIRVEGDADIDTGYGLHPGEQFRGKRIEPKSPFVGILNDPSAWSVVINQSGTAAGVWRVSLLQNGQASNVLEIRLDVDCASSSAYVQFKQNR